LELPAGTFTAETPEAAGRRELFEETGWDAAKFTRVGEFFDDASKNTNMVYSLVATDAYRRSDHQQLEATEASSGLEVIEVHVSELEASLLDGSVKAQSTVASAYQALAWLRCCGRI
jgi:8-oxo-dGTP pyrophosphatase MutT (NUDIX family)